ncbi:MAG: Hsp20/alpha crystallin family protein [Planctomycetota bacterium]
MGHLNVLDREPFYRLESGDDEPGSFKEVFLSSHKLVMMFSERAWHPLTDVYETPDEIVVKVEIAGIRTEDVTITIEENKLTLKGKRYDRDQRVKRVFKQMEINYGKFERVIMIHGPFNCESVRATYHDGYLELVIPKAKKSKMSSTPIQINFEK